MSKEKKAKDKDEKDKHLVMWTGVAFFMFLIAFLWFMNIRTVFSNIGPGDNAETSQFDFNEISEEFNKSFEEIKEVMDELNEQILKDEEKEIKSVSNNKEESIDIESIEALKEKLEATTSTSTLLRSQ